MWRVCVAVVVINRFLALCVMCLLLGACARDLSFRVGVNLEMHAQERVINVEFNDEEEEPETR